MYSLQAMQFLKLKELMHAVDEDELCQLSKSMVLLYIITSLPIKIYGILDPRFTPWGP